MTKVLRLAEDKWGPLPFVPPCWILPAELTEMPSSAFAGPLIFKPDGGHGASTRHGIVLKLCAFSSSH